MTRKRTPQKGPRQQAGHYWLYGLHPVRSALENPLRRHGRLLTTRNAASALGSGLSTPEIVDRKAIDRLVPADAVHQGIALEVEPLADRSLDELIVDDADILIVALDQVTDPHNVGAIMRSAAAFGAAAVVTTRRHAPPETAVLAKAAAGAVDIIPFIRVNNLAAALSDLHDAAFAVVGLDGEAETVLADVVRQPRTVIVMGAEGKGLRQLTRDRCDGLARLPMQGPMESLNVSNAAAVALYELTRG